MSNYVIGLTLFQAYQAMKHDHCYLDDKVPQVDGAMETRTSIGTIEDMVYLGFSFCWDNIQYLLQTKHEDSTSHNTFNMWANLYAKQNQVPSLHLTDPTTIKAVEVMTFFQINNVTILNFGLDVKQQFV